MRVYTFFSIKHNDVLLAIANSPIEAWDMVKKQFLIDPLKEDYIIGSSIKCTYGSCSSTTIPRSSNNGTIL